MSWVKINDGKKTVKLLAKADNKISLQTIRQYFPEADGLTYTVNEETFGLEKKNDDIYLVRNMSSYNIYSAKTKKLLSPLTEIKKKRIDSILAVINGDADGDDKEIVPNNNKVYFILYSYLPNFVMYMFNICNFLYCREKRNPYNE